jgi:transposase
MFYVVEIREPLLETDPTRMCALLVGLPASVRVAGVAEWLRWVEVTVDSRMERPRCGCGGVVHRHGVRSVRLVDLPVFGRPARLLWRKQRWRCVGCGRCWTDEDPEIGSPRCALTTRAARWATFQVGRHGRAVSEVAEDLGCDWHTVMNAVVLFGEELIADPDRIGAVTAIGLDETLFARIGVFRTQRWSTQIVDVRRGQLLDVVEGRTAEGPCRWLANQPEPWRDQISWATLDLSASYRTVYDTMLPDATQVADPFHVVRLANVALDECRRRVQNETLGHRGRKTDPLYRARRRLTIARQRLSVDQHDRLMGLLRAGDPHQEVWFAWNAKEVVRQTYEHTDVDLAEEWVTGIEADFTDPEMPPEVRRLGRTIGRWHDQIVAWHRAHVTNGPTEAINNLAKRIKRVAFGLTNFRHHRIRCLLYAGKPNWTLLDTIQP